MEYIKLTLDSDQHWNNLYLMLKRFSDMRKQIKSIFDENSIPFELGYNEWNYLETFIELLEIPYFAIKYLSESY